MKRQINWSNDAIITFYLNAWEELLNKYDNFEDITISRHIEIFKRLIK